MPVILATLEMFVGESGMGWSQEKCDTLSEKITKAEKAEDVTQMVVYLPSEREATKKKRTNKKRCCRCMIIFLKTK
jgi:hypothetical protein